MPRALRAVAALTVFACTRRGARGPEEASTARTLPRARVAVLARAIDTHTRRTAVAAVETSLARAHIRQAAHTVSR